MEGKNKEGNSKKVALVVILLLVIAIIVAIMLIGKGGSNNQNTNDNTQNKKSVVANMPASREELMQIPFEDGSAVNSNENITTSETEVYQGDDGITEVMDTKLEQK